MIIRLMLMALLASLSVFPVLAAKKTVKNDASARAISKLQMMVKEATAERDRLKTENATVTSELEKVKKELEQEKSSKSEAEDKFNKELAVEKQALEQKKVHLDNTTARLREVIEKYNALNQAKNELAAQHLKLQNEHQFTSSELKGCESKNRKMFEGAKEIIAGYQSCQDKDFFDALIDAEPVTQIKNVEFETIIQEYEDKLNKQKYHSSIDDKTAK